MQFGERIQEIEYMDPAEGENVVPLAVNEVLENKYIDLEECGIVFAPSETSKEMAAI